MIRLNSHSDLRVQQRILCKALLNEDESLVDAKYRIVSYVYENGIKIEQCSPTLKAYIQSHIEKSNIKNTFTRVVGMYIYVFKNNLLITMLPVKLKYKDELLSLHETYNIDKVYFTIPTNTTTEIMMWNDFVEQTCGLKYCPAFFSSFMHVYIYHLLPDDHLKAMEDKYSLKDLSSSSFSSSSSFLDDLKKLFQQPNIYKRLEDFCELPLIIRETFPVYSHREYGMYPLNFASHVFSCINPFGHVRDRELIESIIAGDDTLINYVTLRFKSNTNLTKLLETFTEAQIDSMDKQLSSHYSEFEKFRLLANGDYEKYINLDADEQLYKFFTSLDGSEIHFPYFSYFSHALYIFIYPWCNIAQLEYIRLRFCKSYSSERVLSLLKKDKTFEEDLILTIYKQTNMKRIEAFSKLDISMREKRPQFLLKQYRKGYLCLWISLCGTTMPNPPDDYVQRLQSELATLDESVYEAVKTKYLQPSTEKIPLNLELIKTGLQSLRTSIPRLTSITKPVVEKFSDFDFDLVIEKSFYCMFSILYDNKFNSHLKFSSTFIDNSLILLLKPSNQHLLQFFVHRFIFGLEIDSMEFITQTQYIKFCYYFRKSPVVQYLFAGLDYTKSSSKNRSINLSRIVPLDMSYNDVVSLLKLRLGESKPPIETVPVKLAPINTDVPKWVKNILDFYEVDIQITSEQTKELLSSVEYLTDKEQEIFTAFFILEDSLANITNEFGLSTSLVNKVLYRITSKLLKFQNQNVS